MIAATMSSRLIVAPAGMLLGRAGSSGGFRVVVREGFRLTCDRFVVPTPAGGVCRRTAHSPSHSHSIQIPQIPSLVQSLAALKIACRCNFDLGRCRDPPPHMGHSMVRAALLPAVVRGATTTTTVATRLVDSVMPKFAKDQVRCMSSTRKKRRAMMNKHKLRKRRKKERRKSK